MNRHDYTLIAAAFRAERDRLRSSTKIPDTDPVIGALASLNTVAQSLAESFEAANPRFDRKRFLEAVNGKR